MSEVKSFAQTKTPCGWDALQLAGGLVNRRRTPVYYTPGVP